MKKNIQTPKPKIVCSYDKQLQIATVKSVDFNNDITVHALLQNSDKKQPSINAYLGARYSRSSDSVTDIAKEIMQKGIDPAARLESIFQGYGHKSVGDMADLFLCIENVPMLTAMRTFYLNPTLAGQERSTRYQNFDNPQFYELPEYIDSKDNVSTMYYQILNRWVERYRVVLDKSKTVLSKHFRINSEDKGQVGALNARSFDTARYLIPLGMKTSLGLVMSARNWAEYISRLLGSKFSVDNRLGNVIYELLKGNEQLAIAGYIPEADGLVRYTQPNDTRYQTVKKIQTLLSKKYPLSKYKLSKKSSSADNDFAVYNNSDTVSRFIKDLYLTQNPHIDSQTIEFDPNVKEKIADIIAQQHNHHNQLGNIMQSGGVCIEGYADHGILKDLNRHRSLERYVPLWEDFTELEVELNTNRDMYYNCNYFEIKQMKNLQTELNAFMKEQYELIKKWYVSASKKYGKEFANEYGRYLLPHAHSTKYRYCGSIDDLLYTIHLRVRPGGHIAYRSLVKSWARALAQYDVFYLNLLANVGFVDVDDRNQFIDRG